MTNPDDSNDEATGRDAGTRVSGGAWEHHSASLVSGLAISALLIGTVVYRLMEDWSWVDSLYFSVVTLTTVGYGDLSPTTAASKLFTVFYIVGGISLIGAYLNEVMKQRERRAKQRRLPH